MYATEFALISFLAKFWYKKAEEKINNLY